MTRIENMSVEDFGFAVCLTDTMNWNMVEEDFEFMKELEPDGCFVIFDGSERLGIVTTISYDRVGWLGNLIISEKHRAKGLGSTLVRHSLEYLTGRHVETVGLYSYVEEVSFYRRFGFEPDMGFVALKGRGASSTIKALPKRIGKEDIQEVVDFDDLCFGVSRKKLLRPILFNSKNLCYASFVDERMSGFIMAKVYGDVAEIGPLACRKFDVALELIETVLNRLEGSVVSLYIQEESMILNALKKLGFSEQFHLVRMFLGNPLRKGCIYAAESLERG